MVLVSLSLGRPWERRPRLFGALCVAGFLISLSGHLAPVRGHVELAHLWTVLSPITRQKVLQALSRVVAQQLPTPTTGQEVLDERG